MGNSNYFDLEPST